MKLVIFDLDQTLVDVVPVHDAAAASVFRAFFNVDARLSDADYAGRSLFESFQVIGRLKGIPEDQLKARARDMLDHYDRAFVSAFPPDACRHVLPGVTALLGELERRGHFLVMYTGDSRIVGGTILKGARLESRFKSCFFGTEVEKRSDMVRLAVESARAATGRILRGKQVVVIGDSVRDIEAGKDLEAKTIAVATGLYSREDLRKREPDHLFDNMADTAEVLRAIEDC